MHMSDRSRFTNRLRKIAWGLRCESSVYFASYGALLSNLLMIVIIPLRETLGIDEIVTTYILVVIIAGILGAAVGLLFPLSLKEVASVLDRRLYLGERLQTAVDFLDMPSHPFTAALLEDARRNLEQARPRLQFRLILLRREHYPLLVLPLVAIVLLFLPPVAFLDSQDTAVGPGFEVAPTVMPERPLPGAKEGDKQTASAISKSITAPPRSRATDFQSKPPDFVSFVRSGSDRLAPLASSNSELASLAKSHPLSLERQQPGAGHLESNDSWAEDNTASDIDLSGQASQTNASSNQERDNPSAAAKKSSDGSSKQNTNARAEDISGQEIPESVQSPDTITNQRPTTPAEETAGTPTSDRVEDPNLKETKDSSNQASEGPRFGGGQYPHNAPGAGFPDWLIGPEDPHFMDAGQGRGESTGKTSGQAGVGHAPMQEGETADAKQLFKPKDIHITGSMQEGEKFSYQVDATAQGSDGQALSPETKSHSEYEFEVEEPISKDSVPRDSRAMVRAYFARGE